MQNLARAVFAANMLLVKGCTVPQAMAWSLVPQLVGNLQDVMQVISHPTLHPTPYTLHPAPYTLRPTPYTPPPLHPYTPNRKHQTLET